MKIRSLNLGGRKVGSFATTLDHGDFEYEKSLLEAAASTWPDAWKMMLFMWVGLPLKSRRRVAECCSSGRGKSEPNRRKNNRFENIKGSANGC